MYTVGIADPFRLGENQFNLEKELFAPFGIALKQCHCITEADIIDQMQDCDLCAVVSSPFTEAVIDQLPRCKGILRYGIGVDNIDIDAATKHGIPICYEPKYCVEDVATLAYTMLLNLSRKVSLLDREIRGGNWSFHAGYPSHRLQGQCLGLLGFGNIARRLGELASVFHMKIVAYDPFITEEFAAQHNAEKVDLDTLLEAADFISVHCPLTPETKHLLSREAFRKMKPTAFVINTSRGPIIDTDALLTALEQGEITGAGLDVHETEPIPPDHPLCSMGQVILTPHSGFYTEEAFLTLRKSIASQCISIYKNEKPQYLFNPSVLEV